MCDTGSAFWRCLAPVRPSTGAAVAFGVETYTYIFTESFMLVPIFNRLLSTPLFIPPISLLIIIALALPSFLAFHSSVDATKSTSPLSFIALSHPSSFVHCESRVFYALCLNLLCCLFILQLLHIVSHASVQLVINPFNRWFLAFSSACTAPWSSIYALLATFQCSQLLIVPSPALCFVVKLMPQSCLHFECCSRIIIEGCDVH